LASVGVFLPLLLLLLPSVVVVKVVVIVIFFVVFLLLITNTQLIFLWGILNIFSPSFLFRRWQKEQFNV